MALGYRAGVLTGLGLSLLAALALPRWGRPAAKATIKGGMAAYETAAETVARLRETLEDIAAEVAFERAVDHAAVSDAERAAAGTKPAEDRAAAEEQARAQAQTQQAQAPSSAAASVG
jgi:uncharacterized protein DUF5132